MPLTTVTSLTRGGTPTPATRLSRPLPRHVRPITHVHSPLSHDGSHGGEGQRESVPLLNGQENRSSSWSNGVPSRAAFIAAAAVIRHMNATSWSSSSVRTFASSAETAVEVQSLESEYAAQSASNSDTEGPTSGSSSLSESEFAAEWSKQQRRVAIFVDPSPFSYVCGYKNRFQNFIRYLRELGDEVLVITTDRDAPDDFYGAKVVACGSMPLPFYTPLFLTPAFGPRIFRTVADFKPDVIHSTTPGLAWMGGLIIAKILQVPLVNSYHTHIPKYLPKYNMSFLLGVTWTYIRLMHLAADLTLVTSHPLGLELQAAGALADNRLCVWPKGVDSDLFNPDFSSETMRHTLSGGEPDKPLVVHVGRLGAEKNLELIRPILEKLPGIRFAFVGDGPHRSVLESLFAGTPTVFTGMLEGEQLSAAYASADIFIMPSETETLGFVVIEAMSCGLPVVAARAGGIPDIITPDSEGATGFLFEPGNASDAAAKIRQLVDDRELRVRVGAAARAEMKRWDWLAATSFVRNQLYPAAVYLKKKKKTERGRWLPWWLKRSEWKAGVKEQGDEVAAAVDGAAAVPVVSLSNA